MFTDFIETLQTKEQEREQALYKSLTEKAIVNKKEVLQYIERNFPLFWSQYDQALSEAPVSFLHTGLENANVGCSGFGASGVLLNGLIFAVYRNSYCLQLTVAEYNGVNHPVSNEKHITVDNRRQDVLLARILSEFTFTDRPSSDTTATPQTTPEETIESQQLLIETLSAQVDRLSEENRQLRDRLGLLEEDV